MSGLLFLTTADFHIENGAKGTLLCHNITGFSLILFYSMQCEYCQKLLPDFRKLPGLIGGCQFGMLNISKNKDIISAASKTIAPLEYVPFIILYANGKPFMKYEGAHDVQSIRNFIIDVNNKLQHKQQFSKDTVSQSDRKIPSYCLGQPLYGTEGRSYLEFNNAYYKNQ